MLKFIVCMLIAAALPLDVYAEILKFGSGPDGPTYEARITSSEHVNSVSFYQDDKLLGTYNNLIVSESSLSSSLVSLVGGEAALEIESDGSRNKYNVLASIKLIDGKLYVECLYKNVYDSVEEARSVGAICQRQELSRFDVSASINTDGLFFYTTNHEWLKSLPLESCINPVGFESGSHRIARCAQGGAPEASEQKIVALDRKNRLIFSVAGYELIPQQNSSGFLLEANLKNDVVAFKGNFSCYISGPAVSDIVSGAAKIGTSLGISYTIGMADKCLSGDYSYVSKNRRITLKGNVDGGTYYLLEMGVDRISSGAFILNRIESGIGGVWVGVPSERTIGG